MKLIFSPIRSDHRYALTRTGDALSFDGVAVDFSTLANGATLTAVETGCDWIAGDVTRDSQGALTVPLYLPHGAGAPDETRFPRPITLTADGPVALPPFDSETPEG